jgi:hypothetical protein
MSICKTLAREITGNVFLYTSISYVGQHLVKEMGGFLSTETYYGGKILSQGLHDIMPSRSQVKDVRKQPIRFGGQPIPSPARVSKIQCFKVFHDIVPWFGGYNYHGPVWVLRNGSFQSNPAQYANEFSDVWHVSVH